MKARSVVRPSKAAARSPSAVVVHLVRRAAPLLAVALVAWGCESSPAAPTSADDAELLGILEAHWSELASMEELHLGTATALSTGGPQPAGVAEAVVLAGLFAAEAGGAALSAAESRALADDPWAELTALRLGADGVARHLGGIRTALRALEAAGGDDAFEGGLNQARQALATAEQALGSGRPAAALAAASEAGDAMRSASAEDRAAAWVAAAFGLLEKAKELAGANPSPEIRALLDEASGQCQSARAALDAGDLREAVRHATACARTARMVIARLSGGLPNDMLAERAEAAIEQATALLERANEAAGGAPPPNVQEALDDARTLLGQAVSAFEARDYREAIRAAHASGALSRRVIAWSSAPGGGDGLEARALAALETAKSLLDRATELAGPNPPAGVRALLVSATALVGEARAALDQGDFRTSLARSLEATAQLRRVMHLLS